MDLTLPFPDRRHPHAFLPFTTTRFPKAGGGAPDHEPDAIDSVAASQADDKVLQVSPTLAGSDGPPPGGNADMTIPPAAAAAAAATAVAETVTNQATPRSDEAESAASAAAAAVSEAGGAEAEQPVAGEETAGAVEVVGGFMGDAPEEAAAVVIDSVALPSEDIADVPSRAVDGAPGAQAPEAGVAASPEARQDATSPDVSVEPPSAAAPEASGSPPPAATAVSAEGDASVDDTGSTMPDEAGASSGPGESRPVAVVAVDGVDGDDAAIPDIVRDGDASGAAPPVDGVVSSVDACGESSFAVVGVCCYV